MVEAWHKVSPPFLLGASFVNTISRETLEDK